MEIEVVVGVGVITASCVGTDHLSLTPLPHINESYENNPVCPAGSTLQFYSSISSFLIDTYHCNLLPRRKLRNRQRRKSIRRIHSRHSTKRQNIIVLCRIVRPRNIQRIPHRHSRRIRRTIIHKIRVCKSKCRRSSNIRQMLCRCLQPHPSQSFHPPRETNVCGASERTTGCYPCTIDTEY